MIVLNAVSKLRAAARSKGKVLVGHLRYGWLTSVGFQPAGLGRPELVRSKDFRPLASFSTVAVTAGRSASDEWPSGL
jgi:hypothetical protein